MIYCGIVAGGKGLRMKNAKIPKQFLEINGIPILVQTVKAFYNCEEIDKIYVGINPDWKEYTQNLFEKYGLCEKDNSRVVILNGGENRNATIFNIVKKISEETNINQEDIILTHDGVRPFVTRKIIQQNITAAKEFRACGTYIPAVDTIVQSKDGITAGENLNRNELYQAQTPQTFNLAVLSEIISKMTKEESEQFTDVCGLFSAKGIDVKMVMGERHNFKITTDFDLSLADAMSKKGLNINNL